MGSSNRWNIERSFQWAECFENSLRSKGYSVLHLLSQYRYTTTEMSLVSAHSETAAAFARGKNFKPYSRTQRQQQSAFVSFFPRLCRRLPVHNASIGHRFPLFSSTPSLIVSSGSVCTVASSSFVSTFFLGCKRVAFVGTNFTAASLVALDNLWKSRLCVFFAASRSFQFHLWDSVLDFSGFVFSDGFDDRLVCLGPMRCLRLAVFNRGERFCDIRSCIFPFAWYRKFCIRGRDFPCGVLLYGKTHRAFCLVHRAKNAREPSTGPSGAW